MYDSFKTKKTLKIGKKTYTYYSFKAAEKNGLKNLSALPFSIKVLLENLIRNEDGSTVELNDIKEFEKWKSDKKVNKEINFRPARVLMQDFTGVPAVVDLASMRAAIKNENGDPKKDKKGKFLGISSHDLSKSKRWFDKYGVSLVFWGRLVPGIRTLISVPAGIELMPLRKFLIWTTFGSLIWVALLTYAGYLFGENYSIIETYLDQIKYVVKPILILIFLYFFIRILIRFLKKNRA